MITRVIPFALLLLAPIGVASAQGGQSAARKEVVRPTRATSALPISSVVPAGADSAKAINKYLVSHPKQKELQSVRARKNARAVSTTGSASDSAVIPPPPSVKPRVKAAQVARPSRR